MYLTHPVKILQMASESSKNLCGFEGTIQCMEGECAMTRINNLKSVILAKSGQKNHPHAQAQVDFWVKNDCSNPSICCKGDHCTQFSTGELYSRKSYGYGAYAFRGRMARVLRGDSSWSTWSCFALRRTVKDFHSELALAINMCAASGNQLNSTLHMSVRFGDSFVERTHDAGYDLGSRISLFRFDWFQDVIRFSMNKKIISRVTQNDINIPNEAMFLRVMILPRRLKPEKKLKPSEGMMGANMALQFVAYKKFNSKIDHTELLDRERTLPHPQHAPWSIMTLLLLLVFWLFIKFSEITFQKENPKGYHILLDGSELRVSKLQCRP